MLEPLRLERFIKQKWKASTKTDSAKYSNTIIKKQKHMASVWGMGAGQKQGKIIRSYVKAGEKAAWCCEVN